jgi:hypothetical protein
MPDTLAFLQLLRQLDSPQAEEQQQRGSGDSSGGSDGNTVGAAAAAEGDGAAVFAAAGGAAEVELPEIRAARGLFRCVFVDVFCMFVLKHSRNCCGVRLPCAQQLLAS